MSKLTIKKGTNDKDNTLVLTSKNGQQKIKFDDIGDFAKEIVQLCNNLSKLERYIVKGNGVNFDFVSTDTFDEVITYRFVVQDVFVACNVQLQKTVFDSLGPSEPDFKSLIEVSWSSFQSFAGSVYRTIKPLNLNDKKLEELLSELVKYLKEENISLISEEE